MSELNNDGVVAKGVEIARSCVNSHINKELALTQFEVFKQLNMPGLKYFTDEEFVVAFTGIMRRFSKSELFNKLTETHLEFYYAPGKKAESLVTDEYLHYIFSCGMNYTVGWFECIGINRFTENVKNAIREAKLL